MLWHLLLNIHRYTRYEYQILCRINVMHLDPDARVQAQQIPASFARKSIVHQPFRAFHQYAQLETSLAKQVYHLAI